MKQGDETAEVLSKKMFIYAVFTFGSFIVTSIIFVLRY